MTRITTESSPEPRIRDVKKGRLLTAMSATGGHVNPNLNVLADLKLRRIFFLKE